MPFEFKLPDLGEGVQEGEIVRWLVEVGDTVSAEQSLVEVMTDKVTAELPAPVGGTILELNGKPGEVMPVGTVLVRIDTGEQGNGAREPSATAAAEQAAAEWPVAGSAPAEAAAVRRFPLAVPAVRKLAKEMAVDLSQVSGTGPGGRITDRDVQTAAGGAPAAPEGAPVAPEGSPAAPSAPAQEAPKVERIPLKGMRRIIAEHLLDAQRNTAPYTYVEEVDFTELVGIRERVRSLAERAGVRITYLHFILTAVSMALKEHRQLNATVDPETGDLLVHSEQHLGIAVHTEDGLVVPVLRNVERRKLLEIAREVERLSQAARSGTLTRDDVMGGTFTVTSMGPLGGVLATPVLNTPQVAILGVHRIGPRAVVRNGVVEPRQAANLSFTFDHRYVDGYVGAEFARTLKGYLEDPAVMLFWLAEFRA